MLNVTDQYCISPATIKGRFSRRPSDLSRKCHLCHGSCKSRKRGTRPPSSRYKTGRNIFGKIKAMYERSRVKVKFERSSTLTCSRSLPNIASILFKRVKSTCVCTKKRYICCSAYASECMM